MGEPVLALGLHETDGTTRQQIVLLPVHWVMARLQAEEEVLQQQRQ
jgi:hypothetical protein